MYRRRQFKTNLKLKLHEANVEQRLYNALHLCVCVCACLNTLYSTYTLMKLYAAPKKPKTCFCLEKQKNYNNKTNVASCSAWLSTKC